MLTDPDEQDETVNCGLTPVQYELLQAELRRLPDTVPPRIVWKRIEEQARAEGLFASRRIRGPFKWLTGAGLAAAVVLAVLNVGMVPTPQNASTGGGEQAFPTEPAYTAQDRTVRLQSLNALMVESQQLEQDLRSLPNEPQLVRAGTAATIAAVEDQVAAIDYRLNYAPERMTHDQMELYWRERVRLMNLLVQLRMAQAQRSAF